MITAGIKKLQDERWPKDVERDKGIRKAGIGAPRSGLWWIVLLAAVFLLAVAPPVLAADSLTEVREILGQVYVDPVGEGVLQAPTVEETLKRLGDPYTQYFTAEEYQEFINSIDNTFSGIGVYIDNAPEGILVTGVISGSPAQGAGLKEGDVITHVDGTALAGKPMEYAQGLIKGPEGTAVRLTVKRGENRFEVHVVRQRIAIPTVTGEVYQGHIGYVALNSFGSDTSKKFGAIVKDLQAKGVDSWIIDLRKNPGGYLDTAVELAGYFVGPEIALQTQDRSGQRVKYRAPDQGTVLTQPVVFLVDEWSASAAEILASAVRDYRKALIIGAKTYGKGTVQSLYPLSDGGALKVTTARFYSALGHEINGVGVEPDLPVADHALEVAGLLLSQVGRPLSGTNDGYLKIISKSGEFVVNGQTLNTDDNWEIGQILLKGLVQAPGVQVQQGKGQRWEPVAAKDLQPHTLYYPGYKLVAELADVALDKVFTVTFNGPYRFESVSRDNVQLIEAATGERVEVSFRRSSPRTLEVIPVKPLKEDTEYWLVIHRSIRDAEGNPLKQGAIAVARTVGSVASQSQKVVMTAGNRPVYHVPYGMAVIRPGH